MIHPERIQPLNHNTASPTGRYVLYWMQASQRAHYNHALEFAVDQANSLNKPLMAAFAITADFPHANARHYHFMLQGLELTRLALAHRGIQLITQPGDPTTIIPPLARDACLVVTDRGYLRIQKQWRHDIARQINCPLIQIESDVIVPVETASPKEEYAARTLRPKITRQLPRFLTPLRHRRVKKSSLALRFDSLSLDDPAALIAQFKIDTVVGPVETWLAGTEHALNRLRQFIRDKLPLYEQLSSDPTADIESNLSPYLHFGQISPLYIALQIQKIGGPAAAAFLEQLIVRRELAINFVHYNNAYDRFDCLPAWAKIALRSHQSDKRPYLYTRDQLEHAQTHDPFWNTAQRQLLRTGKMHNYMRMYWGKKIIEWSQSPRTAYKIALELNDKYELDGRDPNGYAGVAWCFGKHDRPWASHPVFGTIRTMTDSGLTRKFNINAYLNTWR